MVALLTADSFNRANGAIGSTDGAGTLDPVAWTALVGDWRVNSNKARLNANVADSLAVIDTGHANVDIRLKVASVNFASGIVFRCTDSTHFFALATGYGGTNSLTILKYNGGGGPAVGLNISAVFADNDIVGVIAINNVITITKNGTPVGQFIDSFNRSATKHGLYQNSTIVDLDDFSVRTVDFLSELSTDTFNRVDSTSLGNTDGAGSLDPYTWAAQGGSSFLSDIVSNTAKVGASATQGVDPRGTGGSASSVNIDYIDAGTPDVQLYAEFASLASSAAGIVFRYVDSSNYWILHAAQATDVKLFKRVAGVFTLVSGTLAGMAADGRVMAVKTSGSTIECYVNGVLVFTTADTALQTATKHGFLVAGGGSGSAVNNFEMWEGVDVTPVISAIGPTEGSVAGGTNVTIAGNNFADAIAVAFGAVAAASFSVINDGYIECVSPAHSSGVVDIIVSTASEDSALGTVDQFTFTIPPPLVSSATPNHGIPAGGDSIVITGAYFTGATSVKFGTTEAASFVVDSDGQITAVTPAHISGVVPIVITTPHGTNG